MKPALDVQPDTPLPRLFAACPETRAIFNGYGLRGCGGDQGPAETLAFFAGAHGVNLQQLLTEVRQVLTDPLTRDQARRQLEADARPRFADAIYRSFFLAALVIILTAGAAWGALLLWKIGIGGSFTGVTVHEVNAHGHAQIMGWVALFIMGFAYQAFPRMWHVDLPWPMLALVSWVGMLLCIVARGVAMVAYSFNWAIPLHAVGVAMEIAAVSLFLVIMLTALARSRQPFRPYVAFALAALICLLLQSLYSGWHSHQLLTAPDRESLLRQIAVFQAPLRDIQIHGMATLMIFAVAIRMFPTLLGVREVSDRRAWIAFGLMAPAVALEVGLFLAYSFTGLRALAAMLLIPWLMLAIGATVVLLPWRLWRPLPHPGRDDRSGKFIRVAFAWMMLSFLMLLLLPIYQAISGIAFSHAYYGAIRHAITVGFISMMIVGMGAKVVATLRGIDAKQLPLLAVVFALLNLGCLLRVGLQIGTDWHPLFFRVVGVSGMLEWIALALWAIHLAAMMLGIGKYRSKGVAAWEPAPRRVMPEHRVAAVIHWHPQTEAVFVRHGFEQIRNPILRRTVARQVTLAQVCRMKGVNLDLLLADLNEAASRSESGPQLPSPSTPIALTIGHSGNGNEPGADHTPVSGH
ncbi:MAG: DUF1858 domain-containing protein [Phycisphaeraceae bacterium]|nr:DUF1858 domain-containing protein [Phycisphaeraceae bacterium]